MKPLLTSPINSRWAKFALALLVALTLWVGHISLAHAGGEPPKGLDPHNPQGLTPQQRGVPLSLFDLRVQVLVNEVKSWCPDCDIRTELLWELSETSTFDGLTQLGIQFTPNGCRNLTGVKHSGAYYVTDTGFRVANGAVTPFLTVCRPTLFYWVLGKAPAQQEAYACPTSPEEANAAIGGADPFFWRHTTQNTGEKIVHWLSYDGPVSPMRGLDFPRTDLGDLVAINGWISLIDWDVFTHATIDDAREFLGRKLVLICN